VTAGGEKIFIERIPGARGQPHRIIAGGGHFIQEDAPEELCGLIDDFIRADAGITA
jgi:haloalkane dehalogenase